MEGNSCCRLEYHLFCLLPDCYLSPEPFPLEVEQEGLILVDEACDFGLFDALEDVEVPNELQIATLRQSQLQGFPIDFPSPPADLFPHGQKQVDGGEVVQDEAQVVDEFALPVLD
jgi:hypothetical protein